MRAFSCWRYPELDALGVESLQGDITDEGAVAAACSDADTVFDSLLRGRDLGPSARLFPRQHEGRGMSCRLA